MNVDHYVFINQKVLKFVGLYPVNGVRFIICILCMLLIVIPQILQIYQSWQDLNVVLETSSVLFTIILAILKSLIWVLNRKNVEPFINFLFTNYWQIVATTHVTNHLDVYAMFGKKITKCYLFLICNALLFFFSLPLIEILIGKMKSSSNTSSDHFPFIALYPSSYYDFPLYQIVYISQMIATTICGLIILATDTLIATALCHTCGHFKTLHENLKNLDTNLCRVNDSRNNEKDSEKLLQEIKHKVANIIGHHQTILWFCENMEKNFNPILLFQTLASSLIICLVGLQVSTTLEEQYKLVKYFSYLIMALSQLLLFCFPGDDLINQSFTVSKAMYSIKWYELSVPIKTEICQVISRSQKPSYITAGKFYVMHLENFNSILSTSLSYFMVLRSLRSGC